MLHAAIAHQAQLPEFLSPRGALAVLGHPAGSRRLIIPEQVRKLAGWGLTQNDIASFVGWSQSLISLGF